MFRTHKHHRCRGYATLWSAWNVLRVWKSFHWYSCFALLKIYKFVLFFVSRIKLYLIQKRTLQLRFCTIYIMKMHQLNWKRSRNLVFFFFYSAYFFDTLWGLHTQAKLNNELWHKKMKWWSCRFYYSFSTVLSWCCYYMLQRWVHKKKLYFTFISTSTQKSFLNINECFCWIKWNVLILKWFLLLHLFHENELIWIWHAQK